MFTFVFTSLVMQIGYYYAKEIKKIRLNDNYGKIKPATIRNKNETNLWQDIYI